MNYLISFVVLLIYGMLCNANNEADKYCEIQDKVCGNNPHPLCETFRIDGLKNDLENAIFYNMDEDDIDFIVTNINEARTMIANGKVKRYNSKGANFRVVKWSDDYGRLAEMKLKYVSVCTNLSLKNETSLEMEQFVGPGTTWDRYFYKKVLSNRLFNESHGHAPWWPLFRAEFDTIGCALYHDVDEEVNMFECFTNKMSGVEVPYKVGEPCSQCDIECSKVWPSLCDTISSDVYDNHTSIVLVLACIMVGIILLSGMVYIFMFIINKKSKNLTKTEQPSEISFSRS